VLARREELGVRVVVVSFAAPEMLAAYSARLGLAGAVLLSDVDRAAYRAFGFARGSTARVWLDPRVWRRYAGLVARGRRPERPDEDTLQLGGDVLVAGGRVTWVYASAGPEDRPTLDEVRAALSGSGPASRSA
jgi:hypothetical protein